MLRPVRSDINSYIMIHKGLFQYLLKKFVFLISFVLLISIRVNASSINMGIYPPIFEIDAKPGVVINQTITLIGTPNDTAELKVQSFMADGTLGQIFINQQDEAVDWIKLSENQFIFEGEMSENQVSKQVGFTIVIPADAGVGDHYIAIIYENQGQTSNVDGIVTKQIGQVSSNILLSVQPENNQSVTKGEFGEIDYPRIVFKPEFVIKALIRHAGDTRFKTFGEVIVRDGFNQQVFQSQLLPLNVIVDSQRQLQNMVDTDGAIRVDVRRYGNWAWLKSLLPDFLRVNIKVIPNNIDSFSFSHELQVMYIPWQLLMIVSLIGVAMMVIHFVRKKKISQKLNR